MDVRRSRTLMHRECMLRLPCLLLLARVCKCRTPRDIRLLVPSRTTGLVWRWWHGSRVWCQTGAWLLSLHGCDLWLRWPSWGLICCTSRLNIRYSGARNCRLACAISYAIPMWRALMTSPCESVNIVFPSSRSTKASRHLSICASLNSRAGYPSRPI